MLSLFCSARLRIAFFLVLAQGSASYSGAQSFSSIPGVPPPNYGGGLPLQDGTVLLFSAPSVVYGTPGTSMMLYNPATNTFTLANGAEPADLGSAVVLRNGMVLLAGGCGSQ